MTATNKVADAIEAVGDAAEVMVETNQDVADIIRDAPSRGLGLAFGAFLIGTGIGGGIAYLLASRRLEAKYAQISADEIESMAEHYRDKARSLEAQAAKRPIDEIVKERGYASPDAKTSSRPMAVQPPQAVLESEDERAGGPDDSVMAEDEVEGPSGVKPHQPVERNIFRDHGDVEFEWNYHEERKRRTPDAPYVIHYDEREEMEGYHVMTLTYYTEDDVLCDERDNPVDPAERNDLIGEVNLERFGHGSNDPSVVFVRNDKLEIVYEVVRSPNSYSEEVHGIRHDSGLRGNLERMRARERDEQED